MKKLLVLLLLTSPVMAGTISTYGSLMTVTLSSAAASGGGGGGSGTTYTYIQAQNNNTASYTGNLAYSPSVTAHSLLLVGCVMGLKTGSVTVSDNNGNSYTRLTGADVTVGGSVVSYWYTANANAGATTVTCADGGGGASYVQLSIAEYGTSSGGSYDVASSATGTSATVTCGNVTTTVTNEFVAAFGMTGQSVTSQSGTLRINYVFNQYVGGEDGIASSPGSYGSTFTTGSSNAFGCVQGAFK